MRGRAVGAVIGSGLALAGAFVAGARWGRMVGLTTETEPAGLSEISESSALPLIPRPHFAAREVPLPAPLLPSPAPSVEMLLPPAPQIVATPLAFRPLAPPAAAAAQHRLLIPVAGITAKDLTDTYTEARSQGREHNAIDIPAAKGTPVLAAADGTIRKLFQSERGGTTLYELAPDKHTFYYYAHLSGYAPGIAEGKPVHQGEVIAFVGNTGNAGPDNYHLHFEITTVADSKRFWDGIPTNPFPLLGGKQPSKTPPSP